MKLLNLVSIASTPLIISIALFFSLFAQGHNASLRWLLIAIFLFLCLIFVHALRHYHKSLSFPVNSIAISCLLMFIWQFCSLFWSPVPSDSFLFILTSALLPIAFFSGFQLSDRQKSILQQNLILLAIIIACYTCYQAFALKIYRPPGFFLNWNTNAAFMGMILLPLCSQYLLKKHFFSGLMISFLIFSICLTISRGALFTIVLGILLLYVASWNTLSLRPALFKLSLWLVTGFILSSLTLSLGLQQTNISEKIVTTLQTKPQPSAPFVVTKQTQQKKTISTTKQEQNKLLLKIASGRHYLWDAGWRMYLVKPWLGWGFGMYHWLYPQYRVPHYGEHGQLAHNDYLQFLLELGPIGLLLLISFALSIFIYARQYYKQTSELEQRISDLGYSAACMAFLVHSSVTFHFYQAAMLIMLGLYLGQLSQNTPCLQFSAAKHIKQTYFYGIVSSIGLFFTVLLCYLMINFNAIPSRKRVINTQQALLNLEKAIKQAPFFEEFEALQSTFLLNLVTNNADSYTTDEQTKLINLALAHTTQAILKNPLRANNYFNQAMLLSMLPKTQHRQKMIHADYQQTLKYNPYHLQARINYALSLFQHNQNEQAKETLKQGLSRFYTEKYLTAIQYLQLLEKHGIEQHRSHYFRRKQNQLSKAMSSNGHIGGNFFL